MATGVKMWCWLRAAYFSCLFCSARASTAPASLVALGRWEGANVSGQVASHTRSLPLLQRTILVFAINLLFSNCFLFKLSYFVKTVFILLVRFLYYCSVFSFSLKSYFCFYTIPFRLNCHYIQTVISLYQNCHSNSFKTFIFDSNLFSVQTVILFCSKCYVPAVIYSNNFIFEFCLNRHFTLFEQLLKCQCI